MGILPPGVTIGTRSESPFQVIPVWGLPNLAPTSTSIEPKYRLVRRVVQGLLDRLSPTHISLRPAEKGMEQAIDCDSCNT